jgi:hypothetical protein
MITYINMCLISLSIDSMPLLQVSPTWNRIWTLSSFHSPRFFFSFHFLMIITKGNRRIIMSLIIFMFGLSYSRLGWKRFWIGCYCYSGIITWLHTFKFKTQIAFAPCKLTTKFCTSSLYLSGSDAYSLILWGIALFEILMMGLLSYRQTLLRLLMYLLFLWEQCCQQHILSQLALLMSCLGLMISYRHGTWCIQSCWKSLSWTTFVSIVFLLSRNVTFLFVQFRSNLYLIC